LRSLRKLQFSNGKIRGNKASILLGFRDVTRAGFPNRVVFRIVSIAGLTLPVETALFDISVSQQFTRDKKISFDFQLIYLITLCDVCHADVLRRESPK
jgi:hypothetical protein